MPDELPFRMVEHVSFRFDWDEVAHEQVTDVLGLDATVMDDGSARWDLVAICVGTTAVVVTVEPDTDQVIVARAALPCGGGWRGSRLLISRLPSPLDGLGSGSILKVTKTALPSRSAMRSPMPSRPDALSWRRPLY